MSRGKKIALGVMVILVALVVACAVVVPRLIDVDRYRPQVVAHIREETGKPANIRRMALTLFPKVSIRVDDFSLANPPGFPQGDFLKVRQIYAELDAHALWDRQILIKSLKLSDSTLHMLSDLHGRWNFENPPRQRISKVALREDRPLFSLGAISKVSFGGGRLTARNLLPSGSPGPIYFQASGVSSQLEQVDVNAFVASTSVWPARDPTRFQTAARMLWGESLTYAAPSEPKPAAQGTLKAESLRFGVLEVTAVKCKLRLFPQQVFVDGLSFDLYGGRATGDLWVHLAGQNPRYSTSARLNDVDVARLLAAFPDARGKMTGKMEGTVQLTGEVTHSAEPLAGMQGKGQVRIRNGNLPSLQLNKNLIELARLSNLGPTSGDPSAFSSISAELNIANQRITSHKIAIVGNGVDVDGFGSLSLAGEGTLNCDGLARIVAQQNPLTNILADLSGATYTGGKLSLPFNLAGTLQNPRFTLKTAGGGRRPAGLQNFMTGQTGQPGTQPVRQAQKPADLVQGIAGLFKKKQSPQPLPPPNKH